MPDFRIHPVVGPARDHLGYGRHVPTVHWPQGERVAVSLVVNWEEGSERSWAHGDNANETLSESSHDVGYYRDLAIESMYEYGSRAGIWRLQRMFDQFSLKTTFYGAAVAFERAPEVSAWVRDAGHEPCGHGYRWDEIWRLDPEEERARIAAAVETIERATGQRPRGWYSRYAPSVYTREFLVDEGGFLYDSDSYNDDLPYFTEVKGRRHLVVPYSAVYNDIAFTLGNAANGRDWFYLLKDAYDYLWDEGATRPRMMSIGIHARFTGQPGRASALRDFIDYAQSKGDTWFARRIDIANHWIENADSFSP